MSELGRHKISQLWLFDEIKPTIYEIVSLKSGTVLTKGQKITIEAGDWAPHKCWKLNRAQITKRENYFWIVSSEDESKYLCGSGMDTKIKMRPFDPTLFVTNWNLEEVNIDQDLNGCCIFRSTLSDLVIDVPEGSNKEGVAIIQYICNGRGNQRWVLENVKDCFVIRNLCSNMILCPQGKPVKQSMKIVQGQFSNTAQQKWKIIQIDQPEEDHPNENRHYLIQNMADPTLFIGVSSKKEGTALSLSSEKQKSMWKLEGSVPLLVAQNP